MNINDTHRHNQYKITLKFWGNDGKVRIYHSAKTRRIFAKIKAENFSKAFVKVRYGKSTNSQGKVEEFYNDGVYFTQTELLQALRAFVETS